MESQKNGRVQGKVALVTGAGSGIGRATALRLAAEGAVVLAGDIDLAAANSTAAMIVAAGNQARAVSLNVVDEAQWQTAISVATREFGHLDILVNNAGISISKPVADLAFDEWRQVLAVNLDGVFLGVKFAINAMRQRGGSIINLASVSGIQPCGGSSAYCASKAAIRMFSKAVAIECADAQNRVRVNVVSPGGVKTPMWEKENFFRSLAGEKGGNEKAFEAMAGGVPSHQFYAAEEVADTILYLASDESSHLSGIEIVMNRGHTG